LPKVHLSANLTRLYDLGEKGDAMGVRREIAQHFLRVAGRLL